MVFKVCTFCCAAFSNFTIIFAKRKSDLAHSTPRGKTLSQNICYIFIHIFYFTQGLPSSSFIVHPSLLPYRHYSQWLHGRKNRFTGTVVGSSQRLSRAVHQSECLCLGSHAVFVCHRGTFLGKIVFDRRPPQDIQCTCKTLNQKETDSISYLYHTHCTLWPVPHQPAGQEWYWLIPPSPQDNNGLQ